MHKPKLLIYHPGALGDMVITFHCLSYLKQQFAVTDLICRGEIGRLAVYLQLADHAFSIDSAAISSLFTDKPAPGIISKLLTYHTIILCSSAQSLIHNISAISGSKVYHTHPSPPLTANIHTLDHLKLFLQAKGFKITPEHNTYQFPKVNLQHRNIVSSSSPLIIHPGSGSQRKNWYPERFIALGKMLRGGGESVVILLGPAEINTAPLFRASGLNVEEHQGDLCYLAQRLMSAKAFIGNDSGVSHLSAFLGVPSLIIFGPSDPRRWKPQGTHVSIVTAGINCAPCFETQPENCKQPNCLLNIQPEQLRQRYFEEFG